jgi:FixJ family two-component response regulator
MKLLIIDDEAHIRQMMRFTLEAAGYEVEEASSGEEGLQRFGNGHSHDVVLLDQKMPGIDGLQTLKTMKGRLPETCVIIVTAFASIDLAVDAMRLGATDFLRKPMTPDALRGAVAAALATRPRTPLKQPVVVAGHVAPQVETLTLNGFQILRAPAATDPSASEHTFRVTHFPDGAQFTVTVAIDAEAVARVARLSRHALSPGGAFWREQAERLLSAFLWSEGKAPAEGRLTVRDVSREDLDLAAAWTAD